MESVENNVTAVDNNTLVQMTMAGDKNAANLLIERNKPFVIHCINIYFSIPKQDREEAILVGMEGMFEATRHFNQSFGVAFLTYAEWRIRQTISRWIDEIYNTKMKHRVNKARTKVVRETEGWQNLADNGNTETSQYQERNEIREQVEFLMDKAGLNKRERKLVFARFSGEKQRILGKRWGISAEMVRQIQMKALDKLQRITNHVDVVNVI